MKLSISIMAHESRERYFNYLREKLGDVPFSIDKIGEENIGIWENCKRSWKLYDKNADYHVVIQDDAIIGNDFINKAIKEIEAHPGNAFSFYFGNRKRFKETAEKADKQNGITMHWLSWGVAICLPVNQIEKMIKYCDKLPERLKKHDDTMIANFLKSIKMPVWYPMPSLVDHRNEDTLMNSDLEGGRKAYKFIGE